MIKKEHTGPLAFIVLIGAALLLLNFETIPKGVTPVSPFEKERYMGTWYEIARLESGYGKGLSQVTTEYSPHKDGSIHMITRGYDAVMGEWKEIRGKAEFVGSETEGKLKVFFFGPFYSGYNVIAIDPHYRYALVAGRNHKHMWLLSRGKTIPGEVLEDYLAQAKELGYDISRLTWTEQ